MNLYLDDNIDDHTLAALLRKAKHTVVRPADAALAGRSDALHLEYAIRSGLVALTSDAEDFNDLSRLVLTSGGNHSGILIVRYDNDPTRDMKPKHIISAIAKLERAAVALVNQVVILNHWR
jgi:predicted nuclease of predicted toxin-antitoxin system